MDELQHSSLTDDQYDKPQDGWHLADIFQAELEALLPLPMQASNIAKICRSLEKKSHSQSTLQMKLNEMCVHAVLESLPPMGFDWSFQSQERKRQKSGTGIRK
jgi:hypothetical protein